MTKFSFRRTLIITSLFFIIGCGNTDSEEKHKDADTEMADSISVTSSNPSPAEGSDKLKGVTVEQRDLNQLFKSISSKELTEEEQQDLIKQYQDSVKQRDQ